MAPAVQATAQIFEDPPVSSAEHYRMLSTDNMFYGEAPIDHYKQTGQHTCDDHVGPSPLGERHINSPPQPKKIPLKGEDLHRPPLHKKSGSASSLKALLMGKDRKIDSEKTVSTKNEPRSKKNKSSTNLTGLLKKMSKRNLRDATSGEETQRQSPIETDGNQSQDYFTHEELEVHGTEEMGLTETSNHEKNKPHRDVRDHERKDRSGHRITQSRASNGLSNDNQDLPPPKKPFLEHKSSRSSIFTEELGHDDNVKLSQHPKGSNLVSSAMTDLSYKSPAKKENLPMQGDHSATKVKRTSKIFDTIAALNMIPRHNDAFEKSKDTATPLSPQELDSEMEAMLGRYDVPQNLRNQLRNLKPEVKAGLMKGDRIGNGASDQAARGAERAGSRGEEGSARSDEDGKDEKRSRSRSRTRSRILSLSKRNDTSPTKVEPTSRSRSKSRPKSIDLSRVMNSKNLSSGGSMPNLNASDSAVTPGDFIHYLREVRKPELVEVGKLHKLRILLRNESVAWTDAFVRKGGMDEVIQLLYRIMGIEWREEHEDNLLHETLLCLKALSTTKLAMQSLEIAGIELFPALLRMLFDPERKGPSEYNTRGVVISLVFAYLSATLHGTSLEHQQRARHILSMMQDEKPVDEKQPLEFVSQMHISRPYRMWCKELTNVTKEVFWIFLHHMNVVPVGESVDTSETAYQHAFFPSLRAPHPAAPYVGGVEWEATQYLALHLDLLNGLIVSLPTREERNLLRDEFRQSGWEKVMGGTLRTCKEKFYGGVHDGLKLWVAAAKHDAWHVEDVRAGPPRELSSPKKSPTKQKDQDEAPKISLDVFSPAKPGGYEDWL